MRYLRARHYLEELLDGHRVDAVAYEEVRRHLGTSAAHVYGGLVAVITSVCEERAIPYASVPVATAKRQATGKGNASKSEMVEAARRQWGVEAATDDEADALWIAAALVGSLAVPV